MLKLIAILLCLWFGTLGATNKGQYSADWDSLDSRPLPQWYDDAKIGIFLHWGVYSVPSFGSEWFWYNWKDAKNLLHIKYMEKNYPPDFTYQDFGPMFTTELFEPNDWAQLFKDAGARYVVLTSKHHEGYTLWPSKYSWGWNALDVGPKRDLVGDLANSIRTIIPKMRFGLYYSLYEWFNPFYVEDQANNFTTDNYVTRKSLPELYEITEKYQPDIVWADGESDGPHSYWRSTEFLAWLFNESPVKNDVVVNDRWGGDNVKCQHGSFYTCTVRYNPGVLQDHKWENCMTLDESSWGYNRLTKPSQYMTIEQLLKTMVETISCGGNLLVNVGPRHDGRIDPIMEERLRQMGKWLRLNGEAIYESKPWIHQKDSITSDVWYTERGEFVYAMFLSWPVKGTLSLGSLKKDVLQGTLIVSLLGHSDPLETTLTSRGVDIVLPPKREVNGEWAWTLKFEGVETLKHKWGQGHIMTPDT